MSGAGQQSESSEEIPVITDFDLEELPLARGKAVKLAGDLRKDYPTLRPYLVLTMKGAYVDAGSPVESMLFEAPELFVSNDAKTAILKHLQKSAPARLGDKGNEEKLKRWSATWKSKFKELSTGLRLLPDSLFEIRFDNLDYAEIGRMQKDGRVDTVRTPQTKASIRIVLGSLGKFASGDGNDYF